MPVPAVPVGAEQPVPVPAVPGRAEEPMPATITACLSTKEDGKDVPLIITPRSGNPIQVTDDFFTVHLSEDSATNVSYSPAFRDSKTKPTNKNYLTDNIMLRLDEYKPTVHLTSDQDANHQDYERAFKAAFAEPDFLHWQNQYQLHQAVN